MTALLIPNPVLGARHLLPLPSQPDFAAYYLAARALNAGLSPYDANAVARVAAASGGLPYSPYLYPPAFAGLLRPVAALPYDAARCLWLGVNLLWLVWGTLLVARATGLRDERRWLVLAALPFVPSALHTLELGQVTGLLLVLVGLAVTPAGAGPSPLAHWLRGVALGLAAGVKVFPALVALPWLARRDWRSVGGAVLGIASLAGAGVALGGGVTTLRYWFSDVLPAAAAGSALPVNQSVWAVADRLFTPQSFGAVTIGLEARTVSVLPLIPSPVLGAVLGSVLTTALVAVTVLMIFRGDAAAGGARGVAPSALALTCALAVTPLVWDHYYLLLLLPVCHLATATNGKPAARWLLIVGCGLLAAHRYWRQLLLLGSPVLLGLGAAGTIALWLAQVLVLQERGRGACRGGWGSRSPGALR